MRREREKSLASRFIHSIPRKNTCTTKGLITFLLKINMHTYIHIYKKLFNEIFQMDILSSIDIVSHTFK